MSKALIVNLFSGPGSLKSGTAAGIFSLLKLHEVDCELPYEFAKDLVWEESTSMMFDQTYLLGNQHHRLWRLKDKVDIILVDSPILFSLVYRSKELGEDFAAHVAALHNKFNNLNIFLERSASVEYVDNGRNENHEQALAIDAKVKSVMDKYCTPYFSFKSGYTTINNITKHLLAILDIEMKYKLGEANE